MRGTQFPQRVPTADVAEGVDLERGGGTSGGDAPAPSEPEVEPGSLTLGTKSNLDLEPGETKSGMLS